MSPANPLNAQDRSPAPRRSMYRRVYPLRAFGMGLGGVLVGSVLYGLPDTTAWHWVLLAVTLGLWPHVAWLRSRLSADPFRTETQNLLIDSAIVGLWLPLMHFNLLPSAVLTTVNTSDKFKTGIKRLWLTSSLVVLATTALVTWWLRPEPLLESSLLVVVCTLPVILLHTFAGNMASYRLIRTVSKQNQQLRELRRVDAATGLFARAHWQEQADAALPEHRTRGTPMCLLMIDIDHFKNINDRHGHTLGDDVIRAVGQALLGCVRAQDCAGRYGGDEFAVVCRNTHAAEAMAMAQRIRESIEDLRLPGMPELRLTSSVGVAEAAPHHQHLREWMNEADAALYRAKDGGRNQVSGPGFMGHTAPAAL